MAHSDPCVLALPQHGSPSALRNVQTISVSSRLLPFSSGHLIFAGWLSSVHLLFLDSGPRLNFQRWGEWTSIVRSADAVKENPELSLLGDTGVRQSGAFPGRAGSGLAVRGQHVTKISIIVTLCQLALEEQGTVTEKQSSCQK